MVEYSDTKVTRAANLIGAVLASVLPVIAIVVLLFVEGKGARLGLIALFNVIFSTCLWFLNEGNIIQVFSATSAYVDLINGGV